MGEGGVICVKVAVGTDQTRGLGACICRALPPRLTVSQLPPRFLCLL